MWDVINLNDGLTSSLIWVGRMVLAILGMLLCMWGVANFLRNLFLALLGKKIKTGNGEKKFFIYVVEFLVGFVFAGMILTGSFSKFLNQLYLFTINFKDRLHI